MNMKRTQLLMTAICMIQMANGQTAKNDDSIQKAKTAEFKYALNRQFTKIATGTAFGGIGNFISVGSDAKSLAMNFNYVTKDMSVWGAEVSGGATEGVLKLFNNEQLNSNFSGELKYHQMLKAKYGARNSDEVLDAEMQLEELNNTFLKDSLTIVSRKELYKLKMDIMAAEDKIIQLEVQKRRIESRLKEENLSVKTADSLKTIMGNIEFEADSNRFNIVVWSKKLAVITKDTEAYFEDELFKKQTQRDRKYMELRRKKLNIGLEEFDITWISFGLRASNNEIKLFMPNNLPSALYADTSFVSQRLSFAYSSFKKKLLGNDNVYWTVGAFVDYTTNLSSLKKVEIVERIPVAGNAQQEVTRTINAYQGSYKERIYKGTVYLDYYRFLGKFNSSFGIHFNPSLNYDEVNKAPLWNFHVGLIVPALEKENQTSIVNIEVFYSRQDIFNYLNNKIQASAVGLRATLPISIKNYKI